MEASENDPCAGVNDEQITALLDYLTLQLKNPSITFDEALGSVSSAIGHSPATVECVRRRHEEKARSYKEATALNGTELHAPPWYTGSQPDDRIWPSLRRLLAGEGWQEGDLEDLEASADGVVARLADPNRAETESRGLVIGYVQSGKTTNFTAVIAKAADAGYRMFIVLSGMSNALRQQTQARLEKQLVRQEEELWYQLTKSDFTNDRGAVISGDFNGEADLSALLGAEATGLKLLGVVKKNGHRLTRLIQWLENSSAGYLANCPTLIIDDESDQASINTAHPEDDPTTINGHLRDLLGRLSKVSYVGYTATPFANVLIDPAATDDLYPRNFIRTLGRPRGYFGAEELFGREPLDRDSPELDLEDTGIDVIRKVPEEETEFLRPRSRDLTQFSPALTDSLKDAIMWFWLASSVRRLRGIGTPHTTMLVHTAFRVEVHSQFRSLVEAWRVKCRTRVADGDQELLEMFRLLWERETGAIPPENYGYEAIPFSAVSGQLAAVIDSTRVIEENSRSQDRLDYTEGPQTVIVIGGNTVARGLTLEGLCSSLFVRASNAYDTLLQMGRWFGFRHGYEDLPRIWMTEEMNEWFHHLATVEQEIRYDVDRYWSEGLTPEEVGIRLRTHPALAITSAAKMRAGVHAQMSFSGRRLQTILFDHRSSDVLEGNIAATRTLLRDAEADQGSLSRIPETGRWLIRGVKADDVVRFLQTYQFHPDARELRANLVCEYIQDQVRHGELTSWSIAVMGLPEVDVSLGTIDLGLPEPVNLLNRSRLNLESVPHANIKGLMSKNDRAVDLDLPPASIENLKGAQLAALRNSPDAGRDPDDVRKLPGAGDDSALLLIYPISRESQPRRVGTGRVALDAVEHVIGVGLVFPEARTREGTWDYVTADLSSFVLEELTEEDLLGEDGEDGTPGMEGEGQ